MQCMQKALFLQITAAIFYTIKPPSLFVDKFHNVHQIQDALIKHYKDYYIPLWMNGFDKSMSSWLNQI